MVLGEELRETRRNRHAMAFRAVEGSDTRFARLLEEVPYVYRWPPEVDGSHQQEQGAKYDRPISHSLATLRHSSQEPTLPTNVHERILARLLPELRSDPAVRAVMLRGSVARGDHLPGSDLDLLVLLADGDARPFTARTVGGILVEFHHGDVATIGRKLAARPGLAYGVLEGRILHDPDGLLQGLVAGAERILTRFRTPPSELEAIRHWLLATRVKLLAAVSAHDELKAGYLASTTSWKVLEGMWTLHGQLMPPGGSVLGRIAALRLTPPGTHALIRQLFEGSALGRAEACVTWIAWFLSVP